MKSFFFILLLGFSLNAIAQDQNDRPLRDSITLIMPVNDKADYESHIPASPFIVGPNILQLFPGETVFIEVEQSGGVITGMKSVKENKNKDKTLEISFKQNATASKHNGMLLTVKNPFKQDLVYEALIKIMSAPDWVKTSIIPVKAGLLGMEMWPDVIVSIALAEWKFI